MKTNPLQENRGEIRRQLFALFSQGAGNQAVQDRQLFVLGLGPGTFGHAAVNYGFVVF